MICTLIWINSTGAYRVARDTHERIKMGTFCNVKAFKILDRLNIHGIAKLFFSGSNPDAASNLIEALTCFNQASSFSEFK
jgi:hypothetical protein